MAIKSLVFALGFGVMSYYYLEHGVSEMTKAISLWRNGPQSTKEPEH